MKDVNDYISPQHKKYQISKTNRINRLGEYISGYIIPKLSADSYSAINLEIGSGHGHWLTSFASSRPDLFFIGIDIISKRILKAENKKLNQRLQNLIFLKAEATEFLCALPDDLKISSTFIMFPDPWPKKRHYKKRLIQNDFLDSLAHHSTDKSELHFRTDHQGYFDWTKEILKLHPDWDLNSSVWPYEASSFFQNLFHTSYTCSAIKL